MSRFNYVFNNLCGTVYRQGNLVYSSDGTSLFSAVGNRVACFDLVRSRSFTFPFEARRNISRLALSPDGAILLAIDDEGHLLMANVFRRVVIHHLNLKSKVADVRFSPTASGSRSRSAASFRCGQRRRWSAASRRLLSTRRSAATATT